MKEYSVYILRCRDGTYYTGVTNDLGRRMNEHTIGQDVRAYTYNRRPLTLVYSSSFCDIREAISWEKHVKDWSRVKKEALIRGDQQCLEALAACRNLSSSRLRSN